MSNAPINVKPHYHRYGLGWGKVGICILENYNSPPTGGAKLVKAPTNAPSIYLGDGGARRGIASIIFYSFFYNF